MIERPSKPTSLSALEPELQDRLLGLIELDPNAPASYAHQIQELGRELSSAYGKFLIKDLVAFLRRIDASKFIENGADRTEREVAFWECLIREIVLIDSNDQGLQQADLFTASLELANSIEQQRIVLDALVEFRGWSAAKSLALRILAEVSSCRLTQSFLARVLRSQGDYQDSINIWSELVSRHPDDSELHFELGKTYQADRRFELALGSFQRVIELKPDDLNAHLSRFLSATEIDDHVNADQAFQAALSVPGVSSQEYESHVKEITLKADQSKTILLIERWLEEFPGNPIAEHLLNACLASKQDGAPIADVSEDYIQSEFDSFAHSFEQQLRLLGYRGPVALRELLNERFKGIQFDSVLDGGCGTGWCGTILRPFSHQLNGVDLSQAMLDKAKRKRVFDSLHHSELGLHLENSKGQYNLIVCLDSLIYFGKINEIIVSLSRALRDDGVLIFNLELLESDSDTPCKLQLNGRYAHAIEAIERALAESGIQAELFERRVLRVEKGEPVYQVLVLGKKTQVSGNASGPSPKYRDKSTSDRIEIYRDLIRIEPHAASAHFQLGNAYLASQRPEDAVKYFKVASKLVADEGTLCNLGNAYAQMGDLRSAYSSFLRALELNPGFVPALNNAGRAAFELGDQDEAVGYLLEAERIEPENAKTQAFLGNLFFGTHDFEQAEERYHRSISIDRGQPDIYVLMGHSQLQQNKLGAAAASYVQAQQLSPQNPVVYDALGHVNHLRGQTSEASFCFLQAVRLSGGTPQFHSHLIHNMIFDATVLLKDYVAECKHWSNKLRERINLQMGHSTHTPIEAPSPVLAAQNRRPLKLGYLHPDFSSSRTGAKMRALVRNHDSQKFQVHLYTRHVVTDGWAEILTEGRHAWRQADFDRPHRVAEKIRSDEIDILIDLAGHMPQSCPEVFLHQPAPVMVSWPTEIEPSIIPEFKWILCDPKVLSDEYRSLASLSKLHLDETFCPFIVPAFLPDVSSRKEGQAIRFCCASEMPRISAESIETWSKVLLQTQDSSLCIVNRELNNESVCRRLHETFGRLGIEKQRVHLGGLEATTDRLHAWSQADIALDSIPVNSVDDSFQALLMGCPVVTLRGSKIHERTTASLLDSLGLCELIADEVDDYVAKVVELAKDHFRLKAYRQRLRSTVIDFENCDSKRVALKIEDQLIKAWMQHNVSAG